MFLMEGNKVPVVRWAALTTTCRDLWSEMDQLPYHTEIQFVTMLSMVQQSTSILGQR